MACEDLTFFTSNLKDSIRSAAYRSTPVKFAAISVDGFKATPVYSATGVAIKLSAS
jgi:hypothetical protein